MMLKTKYILSIIYLSYSLSTTFVYALCVKREPLGMRNGFIKETQLSAKSSYSKGYLPNQGRLDTAVGWCSLEKISYNDQYFQVVFNKLTTVTGIALQGGKHHTNYIKKFKLRYSLTTAGESDFRYVDNNKEFEGVSIHDIAVYRWFTSPVSVQRIRVYATALGPNNHMCLRMELFGCNDHLQEALGMENKIISNSQVTGTEKNKNNARLYLPGWGMYGRYNRQFRLEIDFKQQIVVTAVAIQGSSYYPKDVIKYYKLYARNSTGKQRPLGIYPGNPTFGYTPVISVLTEPITTRYIRIEKQTWNSESGWLYLKTEVYGSSAVGSEVLPHHSSSSSSKTLQNVSDAFVNSPLTWCDYTSESVPFFILIQLKNVFVVTGLSVQGDSNKDYWVTEYRVTYGVLSSYMKPLNSNEAFIGSSGRIFSQSNNWFQKPVIARFVKIFPTRWKGKCCMRLDVRGSTKALESVQNITAVMRGNDLKAEFQQPKFSTSLLESYKITITAYKPYNGSFTYHYVLDMDTRLSETITLNFHAAHVNITVDTVYDEFYYKSASVGIVTPPSYPPRPEYVASTMFDGYATITNLTFFSVSDINGPISHYQVVIAENQNDDINKSLDIPAQESANKLNMTYYLAATLQPTHGSFSKTYSFSDGMEQVEGLQATLASFGVFYVYIRAVAMKETFGPFVKYKLERKSLPKSLLREPKNDGSQVIEIAKGPESSLYYEVIAMRLKLNDSFNKEQSSLYTNITNYNSSGYNQPYIAAVFNASLFQKYRLFVLGNGEIFYRFTQTKRFRRDVTVQEYVNGKLISGEFYTVFQRVKLANGEYFTSPWLKEFQAPEVVMTTFPPGKVNKDPENFDWLAGLAAVPVIMISIAAIYVLKGRRKRHVPSQLILDHQASFSKPVDNDEFVEISAFSEPTYANCKEMNMWNCISVKEFLAFYRSAKENENFDFIAQYNSIPSGQIFPCEQASQMCNKTKNRYKNVIPYDNTLVELEPVFANDQGTYINANFIQSYSGNNSYIATQAPNDNTVSDFWRMVVNQKPLAIVMLTNVIEKGKLKSATYWPRHDCQLYAGIKVNVTKTDFFADFIIRYVTVSVDKTEHSLIHMQFTSWPDHDCPEYPTMLLGFCHRFFNLVPYNDESVIIVHCSAGVGRTGTFILIREMLNLIQNKGMVDTYGYFKTMRNCRMQMIQSANQYIFVYDAIYEAICCGKTDLSVSHFPKHLKRILTEKNKNGTLLIKEDYEKLCNVTPVLSEKHEVALKPENTPKNFSPDVLPIDSMLVKLPFYINAVSVDGYKVKEAFIATQIPFQYTLKDFWTMVSECEVSTIVILEPSDFLFYPKDALQLINGSLVKLISEENTGALLQRKFLLNEKMECGMVEFRSWSEQDLPNVDAILNLIAAVIKCQQTFGDRKIVVMCRNGASRCGVFISCFNALDQLKIEEKVDVFQVVRRTRISRPQFVESLQQYQFIYNTIDQYLALFSNYSNFQ